MNISYDLWPIWCDYLEEQGQDTELLRYYLTYLPCVGDFYIDLSIHYNSNNSGAGKFYEMISGNGYGYSFWLSSNPVEYGNCNSLFYSHYSGGGKRNIDPMNYQTGDGFDKHLL